MRPPLNTWPDDVGPRQLMRRTAGARRRRLARRALTFVLLATLSFGFVLVGAAVLAEAPY